MKHFILNINTLDHAFEAKVSLRKINIHKVHLFILSLKVTLGWSSKDTKIIDTTFSIKYTSQTIVK